MIDVQKVLRENADQKYKSFQGKIVRGESEVLGVTMPVLKDLAKKICEDEWQAFLKEPAVSYEDHMLRALVIATAKMEFDERLERARDFIPEIDNWAVCDAFCSMWKMKKLDNEKFWKFCLQLYDSEEEFKMRVAAVMMMYHFMDDWHIDEMLWQYTTRYHSGYYYKMGAAWAISTCFIKYPEKTEKVLFVDSLDKEIRNKSIQKINESFRVSEDAKERLKQRKSEN
jgi:3-methyladenine DNA glycosylase AlkD